MTTAPPPNTHLFHATYADGEVYAQGHLDQSLQSEDKNAYYDIVWNPIKPLPELRAFHLVARGEAKLAPTQPSIAGVDLMTGAFEMDGRVFFIHREQLTSPLELVYHRVMEATITQDAQGGPPTTTHALSGYILGWKASAMLETGEIVEIERTVRI